MTVHTPRILTEAETNLQEAFAKAKFTDGANVDRCTAAQALKDNGLPTRKVEAFHYTDLRALLAGGYSVAEMPSEEVSLEIGAKFPRLISDAAVLHFRDGYYFDRGEELPKGVTVDASLPAETANEGGVADAVALINNAFANGGVTVSVEEGAAVERTIGLAHAHTGAENTLGATRYDLFVGQGATCRFAYRAVGLDGVKYLNSSVVNLHIADNATVDYILSNEEGDAAQRLSSLNVTIGKGATLNLFVLNVGGKLVRQEINFDVKGEDANLNISGVNLIGGEAHIDVTSRITHHVPNTNAAETFRNVATGRGRGVFQGQINVRQPAQLTDARMACNTLLLSDDCDFSAKPELEIFADDVQCAHGATVADLEDSYLFYLRARGISEKRARQMLIRAFIAEVIEELEDEDLVERLEERVDVWMERHV